MLRPLNTTEKFTLQRKIKHRSRLQLDEEAEGTTICYSVTSDSLCLAVIRHIGKPHVFFCCEKKVKKTIACGEVERLLLCSLSLAFFFFFFFFLHKKGVPFLKERGRGRKTVNCPKGP